MIGIIDYGMGNLMSVFNAFDMLGADARILSSPAELDEAERIVVPGVGAFGDCIANLRNTGFENALHHHVLELKKPVFGICLGMQVMASRGFEMGTHTGLGWFDADVVSLHELKADLPVPHVGWNNLEFRPDEFIFKGARPGVECYFVHSYFMRCNEAADVVCTTDYGGPVTAAVRKGNIFATQFHPEKSQEHGLRMLENFIRWQP